MQTLPDKLILPGQTTIGRGKITGLLAACAEFGDRGLIVRGRTSSDPALVETIMEANPRGLSVTTWVHPGGEPTLSQLSDLLAVARRHRAEWVAGIGGGSVLDLAKACAGLYGAANPPAHYHDGAALDAKFIPFIAVPTTAGTGSEATPNSVLINDQTGQKKSIRADSLMARAIILDADLLKRCPRPVIAHAGMDAYTQAVEAISSRHATLFSDQLAMRALRLISRNMEAVYRDSSAGPAEELLIGSYLTGIAFSQARLGLVHGLAHPLGSRYHVPHGLVCAVCLPYVIELNRPVLGAKYQEMSGAVGEDLSTRTAALLTALNLSSPFRGRAVQDREGIVAETLASGSARANPLTITAAHVEQILRKLFGS